MLGKSVRVKSKLQEKKESGEEKEKIQPLSFFFPFSYNICKMGGVLLWWEYFWYFPALLRPSYGDESAKKDKKPPNKQVK